MKAMIAVDPIGGNEFRVVVSEGSTQSSHRVTVKTKDYDRITGGKVVMAQLVKTSFEFLLEHEPKESILQRFDLMEIARYFPTFEPEIIRRLAKP